MQAPNHDGNRRNHHQVGVGGVQMDVDRVQTNEVFPDDPDELHQGEYDAKS